MFANLLFNLISHDVKEVLDRLRSLFAMVTRRRSSFLGDETFDGERIQN